MHHATGLSTQAIASIFTEEITTFGGSVKDSWSPDTRLIMKAVLPIAAEVMPRDRVRAGVTIRAQAESVEVFPYLFREVCRNGAVVARRCHGSSLRGLNHHATDEAAGMLREAVRACCSPEAFRKSVEQFRAAVRTPVMAPLTLVPGLDLLRSPRRDATLNLILSRFRSGEDRSRYTLMNAITSVARDTVDPGLRWELEKLGGDIASGGILVERPDPAPQDSPGASHLMAV